MVFLIKGIKIGPFAAITLQLIPTMYALRDFSLSTNALDVLTVFISKLEKQDRAPRDSSDKYHDIVGALHSSVEQIQLEVYPDFQMFVSPPTDISHMLTSFAANKDSNSKEFLHNHILPHAP